MTPQVPFKELISILSYITKCSDFKNYTKFLLIPCSILSHSQFGQIYGSQDLGDNAGGAIILGSGNILGHQSIYS